MKTVSLATLKPHSRNPRKIGEKAFAKLCKSIERDPEFMALRPICHDGGVILAGTQRYRACLHLGMETVPADWVRDVSGLDAARKRRLQVVDNVSAGEFDWEILTDDFEIPELEDLGVEMSKMDVDVPEVEDKAGASPWDRVADASEGVMFCFGDIQRRLSVECYEIFNDACPETEIESWLEGVIRACATN